VTGQAQQTLLTQSESALDSMSGVNLDEEAANMMRYQQAYQASAKILEVGSKLFDTILGLRS
jgi:flagellar hook-associated protein 1 FlgK